MKYDVIPYDPWLVKKARELRKNMTFSEMRLWKKLRTKNMLGYDFDRQKPMLQYIVDFYCKELRLVIEVDGVTHDDEQQEVRDKERDKRLSSYGITVIRFSALQVVHDIENVLRIIEHTIEELEDSLLLRNPPPNPSHGGE